MTTLTVLAIALGASVLLHLWDWWRLTRRIMELERMKKEWYLGDSGG